MNRRTRPQGIIAILLIATATTQQPTVAAELGDFAVEGNRSNSSQSAAREPVTVWLRSGRQFSAKVDRRTDANHLWLRFEGRATVLRRPIEWAKISAASHKGTKIGQEEFQQLALNLAKSSVDPESWSTTVSNSPGLEGPSFAERAQSALAETPRVVSNPRVASITVEAYVANWDADIETDGLVVRINALDRQGRSVPVEGSLEVELVASRPTALTTRNYARGRDLGPAYVRLGRWTRKVESATFPEGTTEYRLPFRGASPDVDLDLGSLGLVNAKLAVPGQGVFQASDSHVGLREFSPLRNQRERRDGTRFFPVERLGRYQ